MHWTVLSVHLGLPVSGVPVPVNVWVLAHEPGHPEYDVVPSDIGGVKCCRQPAGGPRGVPKV
jgi:hypothetical protein